MSFLAYVYISLLGSLVAQLIKNLLQYRRPGLIGSGRSTGEGNGKPLQYSCLENPMNGMKRQKDKKLKNALPRLVGTQYAAGDQWRNNSRKNEETELKQKQYTVVDVTGDGSKV